MRADAEHRTVADLSNQRPDRHRRIRKVRVVHGRIAVRGRRHSWRDRHLAGGGYRVAIALTDVESGVSPRLCRRHVNAARLGTGRTDHAGRTRVIECRAGARRVEIDAAHVTNGVLLLLSRLVAPDDSIAAETPRFRLPSMRVRRDSV